MSMESFSAPLNQNGNYIATPVAFDDAGRFYDLIQEQAEQHSYADGGDKIQHAHALYTAIAETKELQAFLIKDAGKKETVGAVTYFDCWTPFGHGVYLEDIITTKSRRAKGVGHFAMETLAQTTLKKGFKSLAWECASTNVNALRFYSRLGSETLNDRHTWRYIGSFADKAPKETIFIEDMAQKMIAYDLPESGFGFDTSHKDMSMLTLRGAANELLGRAVSYRNYSTFRQVSGMHMEVLSVESGDRYFIEELIRGQMQKQAANKWTGHLDITVLRGQEKPLVGVLEDMGFHPLSYGDDRMVPHFMREDMLSCLAYGSCVPANRKMRLTRQLSLNSL